MSTGPLDKIRARDGTHLYIRDFGEGPALLFVASLSMYGAMWDYQVAHFAERGYRCITVDRRGHGRSDVARGGYDLDTLADDLASVIAQLDLRDVTLVAHSFGAMEAIHYLARHGNARVCKLIALGAVGPYMLATSDNPFGVGELLHRDTLARYATDLPAWAYDFKASFFGTHVSEPLRETLTRQLLEIPPPVAMRCFRTLYSTDLRGDLARVQVPVLLLHGALDAQAPLALTALRLQAGIKHAELKVYPEAPHGLFITHLFEVNRDIGAFLAGRAVAA